MRSAVRCLIPLVLAVAVVTCVDTPTGPAKGGSGGHAMVAFAPHFSGATEEAQQVYDLIGVSFDNVRILIVEPPSDTIKDTSIVFGPNDQSVTLNLTVDASPGDQLGLGLQYRSGATVLYSGSGTVTAIPLGTTAPATTATITIQPVGPGAKAAKIVIAPPGGNFPTTAPVTLAATVLDSSNTPIQNPVLVWSASDATLATIGAASGVLTPLGKRGTETVTVTTLNGVSQTAQFGFVPPPTRLVATGGGAQSGVAGAALATPVVVQLQAADAGPVPGQPVTFTASGGASVSPTAGVTDANGNAQTTVTGSTTTGTYTVTATAGTFTASVTETSVAGPAATIVAVSGSGQQASIQQSLSGPLVAKVADAHGNVVTGAAVAWTVVSGSATLSSPTTTTDATGQTSVTLTAGTAPGPVIVSAQLAQVSGAAAATFTETINPGAPAKLAFITSPTSGRAQTILSPVQVNILDAAGNLVPTATNAITIGVGGGTPGATLLGTTTLPALNGVATFTNLAIDKAGSAYELVATNALLTAAVSPAFDVSAGTPTRLTVSVAVPATGTAGVALAPAPTVQLTDIAGNAVPTAGVSITASSTPTGIGGTTTVVTDATGRAVFSALTFTAPGSYSVTFGSTGLTGAPAAPVSITPAAAATLVFTVQPGPAISGSAITPAVQVTARDAFGNTATGFTGTVALALTTNPTGSTFTGTLTATAVAGVATFPNLILSMSGTGYVLGATSPGLTAATSTAFNVTSLTPTNSWINAAGGSWSNPANWSAAHVPLTSDSVVIALAGTYTVTLDTTFTATFITVGGGASAPTLSLSGRHLTVGNVLMIKSGGTFAPTNSVIMGAGSIVNQGTLSSVASTVSTTMANQGLLVASGASAITGTLTTAVGSTLRIGQLDGSTSLASLAVTNAFTNTGAIELTTLVSNAYNSQLSVVAGTLTNAVGGTISSLGGLAAGGTRALLAQINNQGTITIGTSAPLAIAFANAADANSGTIDATAASLTITLSGGVTSFVNTGTITIGSGQTVSVNGGILSHTGGSISGAGTLSLAGTTATLSGATTPGALTINSSTVTLGVGLTTASTALGVANSTLGGAGTLTNATGQTVTINASTINNPIVNQGTLIASGATTFGGVLTTSAGSLLDIGQVDGSTILANLTVSNPFTNNGTIALTTVVANAYNAQLTIPTGTLTNAAGGTISSLPGATAGGTRTLAAQINNQGTIMIGASAPLVLSQAGAAHTNSGTINASSASFTITQSGASPSFANTGTITIGPGQTVAVTGGSLNQNAGTIGGAGTLTLSGVTATLAATTTPGTLLIGTSTVTLTNNLTTATTGLQVNTSTLNGAGTITNAPGQIVTMVASAINSPLVNQGTLIASGASTLGGAFTASAGSMLEIGQVDGSTSLANLTVTNAFTNNGTIALTVVTPIAYSAQLSVPTGTLTNAAGGTILSFGGAAAGGTRTIAAQLNNLGTVTAGPLAPLLLAMPSAAHTNGGTIDASNASFTITQSGSSPSFTNTGTIAIGSGQTVTVSNGALNQNAGTFGGAGALTLTGVTADFAATTTAATLTISSSTVTFANNLSTASTALSVASSTLNGTGTITNAAGHTVTINTSTINTPVVNQGTLITSGATTIGGALTTSASSLIEIGQVDGTTSLANLTVSNGFTNSGTIQLTTLISIAYSAQLTVPTGTLTNAVGGTISSIGGLDAGGSRTLAAQINNLGTINVGAAAPLVLAQANATHSNSGTINASNASLTISQSGTSPSFTNTGSGTISIGSGLTVMVNGGALIHTSGLISGAGTLSLSGATATFNGQLFPAALTLVGSTATLSDTLTTASIALSLANSTLNGAMRITNATGQSTTLNGSTINTPVLNQGTLIASGNSGIGGALTTAAGSTLEVGQVDGSTSVANFTVANSFTNNGLISLTTLVNSAYGAQLTLTSGTLTNGANGVITAAGGLAPGGERVIAGPVTNQGTINLFPGSAGTFTMTNGFTNSSTGIVNLSLGGTNLGSNYSILEVSAGAVTLAGTLNVTYVNGFVPASTNNFDVLQAVPNLVGTFTTVNLPGGLTVNFSIVPFAVILIQP